jgi:hypothetical protein
VNRARLRELGFEFGARAEAGVSDEGAWFAPEGTDLHAAALVVVEAVRTASVTGRDLDDIDVVYIGEGQ